MTNGLKYSKLTDSELWVQLKSGDERALNELFQKHIRSLFNYGSKISQNTVLVEDTIQDLFVYLWEKRDKLSDVSHIKPYLFVSLKRRLIKAIRRIEKRSFTEVSDEKLNYNFLLNISDESEFERTEIEKEHCNNLKIALGKLTSRQKEAVFLKYYQKLSFSEVAEIMSIETKTTYKLVSRAIDVLKGEMKASLSMVLTFLFQIS